MTREAFPICILTASDPSPIHLDQLQYRERPDPALANSPPRTEINVTVASLRLCYRTSEKRNPFDSIRAPLPIKITQLTDSSLLPSQAQPRDPVEPPTPNVAPTGRCLSKPLRAQRCITHSAPSLSPSPLQRSAQSLFGRGCLASFALRATCGQLWPGRNCIRQPGLDCSRALLRTVRAR